MLGASLSPTGVDRVLCGHAAARRATPADGGPGRPRRAARTSVPALADRLDVGCRRSGLVLDQEHRPLYSPTTACAAEPAGAARPGPTVDRAVQPFLHRRHSGQVPALGLFLQ